MNAEFEKIEHGTSAHTDKKHIRFRTASKPAKNQPSRIEGLNFGQSHFHQSQSPDKHRLPKKHGTMIILNQSLQFCHCLLF